MSRSSPDLPSRLELSSGGIDQRSISSRQVRDSKVLFAGKSWGFWIAWVFFLVCDAALCKTVRPFGLDGLQAAILGVGMGLVVLLAELRLLRAAQAGLARTLTLLGMSAPERMERAEPTPSVGV